MTRVATFVCILVTSTSFVKAAPPCTPIDGLSSILRPGAVAVFGEMHGTVESPAFVEAVICLAAERGLPIVLGVEQDHAVESATNRFVASPGADADRQSLLAQPFWADVKQDGRASAAMFHLIDLARQLTASGRGRVRVIAFSETAPSGQERDRLMAANIRRAVLNAPEFMTVLLTGNLHSKMAVGVSFDAAYEPMGLLLQRQMVGRRVFGFDVSHPGGFAWMCEMNPPGCGPHGLRGTAALPPNHLVVYSEINSAGYGGAYGVGRLTASEPAVRR